MGNAPVRGVGASEPTTITKSDAEYMDEARRFVPGARRVPAMNTANLTWHRPDGFEIGLELGGGDDFAADEVRRGGRPGRACAGDAVVTVHFISIDGPPAARVHARRRLCTSWTGL